MSLRNGKLTDLESALREHGQGIDELISAAPELRRKLEKSGGKNLANAVHALLARLRAGEFPIRPEDCRYCAFQPVCRITERRFYEVAT